MVSAKPPPPPKPSLPPLADEYLAHLTFERRLSKLTVVNYRRDLTDLAEFAAAHNDPRRTIAVDDLRANDIRRFLAGVHSKGMSPRAISRLLSGWRGYFRYCLQHGQGQLNPCEGVRAPKAPKRLPQTLSPEEAIKLVSFDDVTPAGIRDRAAFELLYSCGLRIAELVGLNLDSIDYAAREIRVAGKGNKTRIIPVGAPAIAAVKNWLLVRESGSEIGTTEAALFLGASGKRITATVFQKRIKQWAVKQGIDVNVHPHMLRHSFASHILQSSQNLRAVQEMMGHASIASTQVYTHLDFQHLAKVYDSAHPRAKKKDHK